MRCSLLSIKQWAPRQMRRIRIRRGMIKHCHLRQAKIIIITTMRFVPQQTITKSEELNGLGNTGV